MFLKPFRIKTSTAIRGSDRRKLRSEVGRTFPALPTELLSEIIPNKEEMTVTRIVTHSGDNVTAYCLSGEPIFFEIEKTIFPTVYTLWKYTGLLPSFATWPPVFEKLIGGADLMLPGVILPAGGIGSFDMFEKNSLWCVTLKGNRSPVAVGLTTVSRKDMYQDDMRGKGVNILHVYTDYLWAHGSKTPIPQIDEAEIEEKVKEDEECNEEKTDEKSLAEEEQATKDAICENTDQMEGNTDVELLLRKEMQEMTLLEQDVKVCSTHEATADSTTGEAEEESGACAASDEYCESFEVCEDTLVATTPDEIDDKDIVVKSAVEEMDDLMEYCFFCALLRMKVERDIPMLTSAFFRNHLLPYCPEGKSIDVKKSSYKKLSKFLQSMQERGLLKVQEVSKGVDNITDITLVHEEIKAFKSSVAAMPPKPVQSSSVDTAVQEEGPCIEEMLSVSAALVRIFSEFGYTKGSVLSQTETRKVITNYVKAHELVSKHNKRFVILDPRLTSAVVNKNEDIQSLPWDGLFTRVANKMNSCYKITLPGHQPVVKKGKIDPLEIKIEQRMGNKKVTLVRNLDAYGIDPQEFAHRIQLRAACSTSVSQLPGKHKVPGMQVLVQGNQIHLVAVALLEDYRIPKKFITGLELLKSGKKKK